VDADAAARAWIEGWTRAWPAADADAVAALYVDRAAFRSAPFRELQSPREYAAWAFEGQESCECRFGEPVVLGERAFVEYWGVVTASGRTETIAGIAVLRFAPDGRVAEQHDYWHAEEGSREPPPGWGT
jgi:ketosteroid isomerase-like protein